MLSSTSSSALPKTGRHLSVCQNSNPLQTEKCSVLLVEPAMIRRSDRERLLSAANYCVTAVLDVREMFDLRFEETVAFAALNDLLGPFGLKAAAESVRRQWPHAKILIIGCAVATLEDHLYDESISHRHEQDGLLEVLHMLAKDPESHRMVGGYEGYRRAATALADSDPIRVVTHARL